METLSRVKDYFLDFLFPKDKRVYELERLSPAALLHMLPAAKDIDDRTVALFDYKDRDVRALIWEIKYRGNRILAKKCGEILADVLRHELADRALFENFIDPILVPMPVSDEKRRECGFNQTEVLSESVRMYAPDLFEYAPILVKHRHTESQARTHATKRERETNLHRSMNASPDAAGRNIILLDDVTTSGATFNEAKRALQEAGVKKILFVALAH